MFAYRCEATLWYPPNSERSLFFLSMGDETVTTELRLAVGWDRLSAVWCGVVKGGSGTNGGLDWRAFVCLLVGLVRFGRAV